MTENQKPTGIKKLWSASIYSAQGLKACYQSEYAFRLEVWLALFLVPAGYWLGESSIEKVLLIVPIFLVLIVDFSEATAGVGLIHGFNPFRRKAKASAVIMNFV